MSAIGKIFKAMGKTVDKTVSGIDHLGNVTGGKIGEKIVDSIASNKGNIGDFAKKAVKGTFIKIPEDKRGSVFTKLVKHRLNNKLTGGILAGTGAIALTSMIDDGNNTGKLGEIDAGELSNMINFTRSPELEETIDAMDKDEKYAKERTDSMFSVNTHGAEGDLVFALHNLRNG